MKDLLFLFSISNFLFIFLLKKTYLLLDTQNRNKVQQINQSKIRSNIHFFRLNEKNIRKF